MVCVRCGLPLSGKQSKYCSTRCSKLHLKSLYRKRNRDKVRAYNNAYRRKAVDAYFVRSEAQRARIMSDNPQCLRCKVRVDLQLCHIKPHWAGGTNQDYNFIVLCRKCHHDFDWALRGFWGGQPLPYEDFDAVA